MRGLRSSDLIVVRSVGRLVTSGMVRADRGVRTIAGVRSSDTGRPEPIALRWSGGEDVRA